MGLMQPARGLLRVTPVETGETLPGSAILLIADARARMTANQCEVVAIGAFAACDDEECEREHETELCWVCKEYPLGFGRAACCGRGTNVHAHPIRVGDWLLVEPRSYLAGPEPERREWYVHQDKVVAILGTETEAT